MARLRGRAKVCQFLLGCIATDLSLGNATKRVPRHEGGRGWPSFSKYVLIALYLLSTATTDNQQPATEVEDWRKDTVSVYTRPIAMEIRLESTASASGCGVVQTAFFRRPAITHLISIPSEYWATTFGRFLLVYELRC